MKKLAFSLILASGGLAFGCDSQMDDAPGQSQAGAVNDSRPLEVRRQPLSLGIVSAKSVVASSIYVDNRSENLLSISKVRTSCPCFEAVGLPVSVGAGETARVEIKFDPTLEPEFSGRLKVDLEGLDLFENVLFKTQISVEVQSVADESNQNDSSDLNKPKQQLGRQ